MQNFDLLKRPTFLVADHKGLEREYERSLLGDRNRIAERLLNVDQIDQVDLLHHVAVAGLRSLGLSGAPGDELVGDQRVAVLLFAMRLFAYNEPSGVRVTTVLHYDGGTLHMIARIEQQVAQSFTYDLEAERERKLANRP